MNTLIVLSALFAAAVAAPGLLSPYHAVAVPHAVTNQHHAQDAAGHYRFGYADPNSQKEEVRSHDGSVAGSYSYISPEGIPISTTYTAGPNGVQVSGAHLPQPVGPTPEVAAAAAQHEAAKVKAAHDAAINPEYPVHHGYAAPYLHAPLAYAAPYNHLAAPYNHLAAPYNHLVAPINHLPTTNYAFSAPAVAHKVIAPYAHPYYRY